MNSLKIPNRTKQNNENIPICTKYKNFYDDYFENSSPVKSQQYSQIKNSGLSSQNPIYRSSDTFNQSFESILTEMCTPINRNKITYKLQDNRPMPNKRKCVEEDSFNEQPSCIITPSQSTKSFELLLNEYCTPPKTRSVGTQTDFSDNSMSLNETCNICKCTVRSDVLAKLRRTPARINYAESLSSTLSGVFIDTRRRYEYANVERIHNNWEFDINLEEWLERAQNQLMCVSFDRKCQRIPIFVNTSEIQPSGSSVEVKRYRYNSLIIYRIDQVRTHKVAKDLNASGLIGAMTQDTSFSYYYTEQDSTPQPIPDSYVPIDDNGDNWDTQSCNSLSLTQSNSKLETGFRKMKKNKELILQERLMDGANKSDVQAMINQMLTKIIHCLKNDSAPYFNVRSTSTEENCYMENNKILMKSTTENAVMKRIAISASGSKAKFLLMMYLLKKIYCLLENDTKITKREIYYQIKHLVKTQSRVDEALCEISCLLNVGQWELNLLANHGLVYGNLNIVLMNNESINCNVPGTSIPYDSDGIIELQSNASFILIVEKESIFHKLLEENLPNKLSRPFIMITGKGHPDHNTKLFVNKLTKIMKLPVFILVDADVHGVKIMMEYRFGCVKSSHLSNALTVPNAKWLGVFPSEIKNLAIKKNDLSSSDKKMLNKLIDSKWLVNHPKIRKQLQVLKTNNQKAAIEGLIKNNTFLSETYLPVKFFNQDFI